MLQERGCKAHLVLIIEFVFVFVIVIVIEFVFVFAFAHVYCKREDARGIWYSVTKLQIDRVAFASLPTLSLSLSLCLSLSSQLFVYCKRGCRGHLILGHIVKK